MCFLIVLSVSLDSAAPGRLPKTRIEMIVTVNNNNSYNDNNNNDDNNNDNDSLTITSDDNILFLDAFQKLELRDLLLMCSYCLKFRISRV